MPIYEYHSPDTNKIYQFFSPAVIENNLVPTCPDGKNFKMNKIISGFSITGNYSSDDQLPDSDHNSNEDDLFSDMEPAKANQVMSEIEKSMQGMDDENPDPRQMGTLMRKICDMTGESIDEPMEEVMRKLEEGVSPDQIEDSMADVLEDSENGSENVDNQEMNKKKTFKRKSFPVRDPELYDFRDFSK